MLTPAPANRPPSGFAAPAGTPPHEYDITVTQLKLDLIAWVNPHLFTDRLGDHNLTFLADANSHT